MSSKQFPGQMNLFGEEVSVARVEPVSNFRIVELVGKDARGRTDHFNILKKLIAENEEKYPGIDKWFAEKVIPGLVSAQRIGYVALDGEKPVGTAVLKIGERSKFCHLKINEEYQDKDLGQLFFTIMTLETRAKAEEVHFTLPEGLWTSKKAFFESFGFDKAEASVRQYRKGEDELACSAPHSRVWAAALAKLPKLVSRFSVGGYSLNNSLLMSVRTRFAQKIMAGEKTVEVRRKFSKNWIGCRVVVYGSGKNGALVGEATIKSVVQDHPKNIWLQFGQRIACSVTEYDQYSSSADQVYAIELGDVLPYRFPIMLQQISQILHQPLRPPQSYFRLDSDESHSWAQAVSVASLLHAKTSLAPQTEA